MDKLEKVIKGKNIKHMLDAFFNKYIKKHFNEVHSIDFIISDLGERMNDGGRNIKILRNDNPVRTNNPDWFPPKPQQTDHICTFLKQLIDNNLGTKDSYVGLKVDVVTPDKTYTWDVQAVEYYENSGTVILKTEPRSGISIDCPAIVKLYVTPLFASKAVSSIVYDSIVTSESKYNFILGERNIHKGEDNVWIFGKNNISGETNHNSLINGYNNDVDSYGNIVIGDGNKHRSLLGATIGRYIKNFKQHSFLFGEGHDNSLGSSHEAVFGKYSNIASNTAFAIGDGTNENNRHNLFEIKSDGRILDKDGNDIRNGSKGSVPMTEITWAALKNLRDTSKLVPGMQYKITDYITTTIQENTRSAGHQFDIIVVADNINKLNENARACLHEGDTYFANCKLESWQLKYCIDNDNTKFAWADTTNGKGVIYRMIDEWNNDCPYDFKNIQFKRWAIVDIQKDNVSENILNSLKDNFVYSNINHCFSTKSSNFIINGFNYIVDNSIFNWYYTFGLNDATIQNGSFCINNKMCSYNVSKQILNNNIFVVVTSCQYNTFGDSCQYNTFGSYCKYNTFDNYCHNNIFGSNCTNNIFDSCQNNIFGNDCLYNVFGNDCRYNTFGSFCQNNIFGNTCYGNIFDNYCYNNTFGSTCNNNIFDNCSNNIFGNNCCYNTFGSTCNNNIFGNYCQYNIFSNYCWYNTFGNCCLHNKIIKNFMYYVIVENGNKYINITSTQTTSSSNKIQNIKIVQGVNNSDITKNISHNTVNDTFQTIYKPIGSVEVEV